MIEEFENQLTVISNNYYYNKHENITSCEMIKINNKFYRKISTVRKMTYALTTSRDIYLKNILNYNYTYIMDITDCFNIDYLKIDGIKTNNYNLEIHENNAMKTNDTIYNFTASCTLKNKIKLYDGMKVEISYSCIEPLSDLTYTTRLDKACSDFSLVFIYNPNDFDVYCQAFSFDKNKEKSKKNVIIKDNKIMISFDGWLLIGEGTSIIIKSLKNNEITQADKEEYFV